MIRRVLLTFVIAQSVASAAAWACSCMPPDTDSFSTVFVGKARGTSAGCSGGPGVHVTTFDVEAPCRGDLGDTVQIWHRLDGDSCGVEFTPGERVVVFAEDWKDGKLLTGTCAPNEAVAAAECPEL